MACNGQPGNLVPVRDFIELTTQTQQVGVNTTGDNPVENITMSISGADAGLFQITQQLPSTTLAGAYSNFTVGLIPGVPCVGTGGLGADKPEAVLTISGTSCGQPVLIVMDMFANCNVLNNVGG